MHRYLAEFDFRYSTKNVSDKERADIALKSIGGKRLIYWRMLRSQPDYLVGAHLIGERRKRWTR